MFGLKSIEFILIFIFFTAITVNMNSQLSKIIRFHRKKSGLTQTELAGLAGLGKTVIFDVENGKTSIRFDTLLKILAVLNIKVEFQSPLMTLLKDSHHEES